MHEGQLAPPLKPRKSAVPGQVPGDGDQLPRHEPGRNFTSSVEVPSLVAPQRHEDTWLPAAGSPPLAFNGFSVTNLSFSAVSLKPRVSTVTSPVASVLTALTNFEVGLLDSQPHEPAPGRVVED